MITLDARLTALSSPDLLASLERAAAQGREVTADLIALLAECDTRKLYAAEGCGSLFDFCVARLRLSEAQAYHRIQAARAARNFPLVLERLRAGRVTMTAVALLRQYLTDDNHRAVLDWAEGRCKREVEMFVRHMDPKPDVPASLRRLAAPSAHPVALAAERQPPASAVAAPASALLKDEPPTDEAMPLLAPPPASALVAGVASAPLETLEEPIAMVGAALVGNLNRVVSAPRIEIRPLALARYSLRVTITQETHDKLRRAQDLLRHVLPAGDPALVLDRALTLLLAHLEQRKAGAPPKVRPATRAKALSKAGEGQAIPKATTAPEAPLHRECSASSPPPSRVTAVSSTVRPTGPAREGFSTVANGAGEMPTPRSIQDGSGPLELGSVRPRRLDSAERGPGHSRYIPAAIRRAVWDRDGARCAYVSANGVRCAATAGLEFHHRVPFAEGGASTVQNLALACVRHNAWEATRWFNSDRAEFKRRTCEASESGC